MLEGDYRPEHLFTLGQSLQLYRFVQAQVAECHQQMEQQLRAWDSRIDPADHPLPPAALTAAEATTMREHCYSVLGWTLPTVAFASWLKLRAAEKPVGAGRMFRRFRAKLGAPKAITALARSTLNRKARLRKSASRMGTNLSLPGFNVPASQ